MADFIFFIKDKDKAILNKTNPQSSYSQQNLILDNTNTENKSTANQLTNQEIMEQNTVSKVLKNFSHEVTIETNKGQIVFLTYDADAPNTVNNFLTLAGKGFYDGVIFHRVIDKFMIQGGDPTGTGRGGPGYTFADELNPSTESYQQGYVTGTVAMANAGPNTNGSQFFIMVADYPLPNDYTIFGKVIKGQEIADAIAKVEKDANDKPLQDVVMEKVSVKKIEN